MTTKFRAVLLDWRGTLPVGFGDREGVAAALASVGRAQTILDEVLAAIRAANDPDDRLDGPGVDCDAQLHRRRYEAVLVDAA